MPTTGGIAEKNPPMPIPPRMMKTISGRKEVETVQIAKKLIAPKISENANLVQSHK